MHPPTANGIDPRLSFWLRVREFAVPPSMIETATERRLVGDWSGACAAAGFDADIDLPALTLRHGRDVATQVLADLRHLAPDLLRWHLPRMAPDGLLRPGLTVALARYGPAEHRKRCGGSGSVHLVARTAPAWADAGQRIVLALWDGTDSTRHPHPHPNRRYRLDLHRHLWDARRYGDLRMRCGTGRLPAVDAFDSALADAIPEGCAVDRWAAEADIVLRAEGQDDGPVRVRCGGRYDLVVSPVASGADPAAVRLVDDYPRGRLAALPVLPDAATWVLPDLELIRSGAITADGLHPLVAAALEPGWSPPAPSRTPNRESRIHLVDCRGERHRIGLAGGALTALDHDPAEIRREELLAALGGTPLPCLQAIDRAHRRPDCLPGVRERLDHGDAAGALAVVEGLLGPDAVLRDGPLLDVLRASADRRSTYDRFRAEPVETPPVSRPRYPKRSRRARSH
ncbi:hypothetical protein M2280_002185 [Prescottella agglutinans]|uniref:Uncharacterized protein n=2 Tax=Prescottella agglutinans TaxID=1644129 RepID=A0ABT6M9J7_9NOCA|nr:hypothetical protein [Prescottella agglutinans]MDH6280972.1 hypothetical protein [Prescottella agglutinans]